MQENRFQLAGYLAAKPTLRYLPSSMPVANARLGQTYRFPRKDKPADHTNWFSLVFYGDLAMLASALEKGTNLYVEGTFDLRPYVDQNKHKRLIYEVNVHKFFVIGGVARDLPASSQPHETPEIEDSIDEDSSSEATETHGDWLL